MNATMITCPNCGVEMPLSEALLEQFRHENEARLNALAGQAEQKARADFAVEKQFLEGQLTEERRKCRQAQQAELQLRKERGALDARARELDLEVARRVDDEKQRLAEQQDLRLRQKDKLIEDLRTALEEARRKSEQGSQERQGEMLEIDIEAELARRFPQDAVLPVPKGARGADLVQEVRDRTLRVCGTIVWEIKNTRAWHRPGSTS
jgi:hypothetical protein